MNSPAKKKPNFLFLALSALTGAATLYLAYMLYRYGSLDGYLDHIESSIVISSMGFVNGSPLYQELGEWPFLASFYGPVIYLVESAVFAVAGASVPLSKLAGLVAVAAGTALFFVHARRNFGVVHALFGVLMFIAFLLVYAPYSIWARPDPFIIFLVALAVYANGRSSESLKGWKIPAVIGVCIGVSVNLKVHSFIYFLPLMLECCGWKGLRQAAIIAVVSVTVFLAPFTLPGISFVNYVTVLSQQVSVKSVDVNILLSSLRYAVLFISPGFLLAGLYARGRDYVVVKDATYFWALTAGVVIMLFPASVPGQGYYHLLPLFPITIDVILRLVRGFSGMERTQKGVLAVLAVLLLTLSVPVQRRLMRNLDRLANEAVAEEIRRIAADHPKEAVGMGYGESFENYRYTFYKPILVLAGNPPIIDTQTVMQFQSIGIDVIGLFSEDLLLCKPRHWLIPKGERPFHMKNYYFNRKLFGTAIDVFQDRYHKTDTYIYFDLWSCKNPSNKANIKD